jgi:hypothetical protein
MKRGMSLENLLTTVIEQRESKRDFVANTKEAISMVAADDMPNGVALVLLKEGASELERFSITENCHRQIAGRLSIPIKHYFRLLADYRELVLNEVNAIFKKEPQTRLLRTLDGKARAFLSDRYRTIDNDEVIEQVLPPIVQGDVPSQLLSSNVSENAMHIKVLFTGDDLAQDIGELSRPQNHIGGQANGETRDIIRPGAVISNSETGHGRLRIDGFFYRDYCLNGCVYGTEEIFSYKRNHIGGRLEGDESFRVFSDDTKRKQNELIIAEITDAMQALTNRENVQKMGDKLRALKQGEQVSDAFAAVDQLAKEVDIRDGEKQDIISNLLSDGDFTRWGMLNAVTKVANTDAVDYERACELENIGSQIIDMQFQQWNRVALAEAA